MIKILFLFNILFFPLPVWSDTSQASGQSRISATSFALTEYKGSFQGFKKTGQDFLLCLGTRQIPLNTISRITFDQKFSSAPKAGTVIILPDLSEIWGELKPTTQERVCIKTGTLGDITFFLEDMLGMAFPGSFKSDASFKRFRSVFYQSPENDTLYTSGGEVVKGILKSISTDKIIIDSKLLGKTTFPISKINGLTLVQLAEYKQKPGMKLGFSLSDGCFVWGSVKAMDLKNCEIKTIFGPVKIMVKDIREILVQGGKYSYLSDMVPLSKTEKSFIGKKVWKMRKNFNVFGGPLKVQNKFYRRGLGVHSYSKLTYSLNKNFTRFQALAGLDDIAIDEEMNTSFGNVVFNIYVDGQKKFTTGNISWNDPPKKISLDVTGAQTISLEVDYGAGFHILDRADWIEARLLKKE